MKMKKILLALCFASLIFASCIKSMEEMESSKVAGIWAVVDGNNLASRFFVFESGYLYEHQAENEYLVQNNILWAVKSTTTPKGKKYKYSLLDGVLYYNDYYKDVQVAVSCKDGIMTLGDYKCILVNEVYKSRYSKIILSEQNKTQFTSTDKEIEWDYTIDNAIDGAELIVKKAPQWCGGAEGVTVEDGKIYFTVNYTEDNSVIKADNKIVLSYPGAYDIDVTVTCSPVEIILEETSASFRFTSYEASFECKAFHYGQAVNPVLRSDSNFIQNLKYSGGKVSFYLTENTTYHPRSGKIKVTYNNITVEYKVIQASKDGYGYWIGDWTITGANDIQRKITFSPQLSYSTYIITGYDEMLDEYTAVASYYEIDDLFFWKISNQILGKYVMSNGCIGDLWMFGADGSKSVAPEEDAVICECRMLYGNPFRPDAQIINASDDNVEYIALGVEHNGDWSYLSDTHDSAYPTFPLTITWAGK